MPEQVHRSPSDTSDGSAAPSEAAARPPRRRVYRVLGRETPLTAALQVGVQSAPVALLDISATGAGLFVPRAACRLLASAAGGPASGLKLLLRGVADEGEATFGLRVVGRRIAPQGVRLSVAFILEAGARSVLKARLRAALNERGAVRVSPPEEAPVRADLWLPDGRRLSGGLRDASVVALGVEVKSRKAPPATGAVIARIWLGGRQPVQVQAALVRVAAVFDSGGANVAGRWCVGLCFAPNGEAACSGGMAISRYVVRLQLGSSRRRR
jgi:hypothetical protein